MINKIIEKDNGEKILISKILYSKKTDGDNSYIWQLKGYKTFQGKEEYLGVKYEDDNGNKISIMNAERYMKLRITKMKSIKGRKELIFKLKNQFGI